MKIQKKAIFQKRYARNFTVGYMIEIGILWGTF